MAVPVNVETDEEISESGSDEPESEEEESDDEDLDAVELELRERLTQHFWDLVGFFVEAREEDSVHRQLYALVHGEASLLDLPPSFGDQFEAAQLTPEYLESLSAVERLFPEQPAWAREVVAWCRIQPL